MRFLAVSMGLVSKVPARSGAALLSGAGGLVGRPVAIVTGRNHRLGWSARGSLNGA
jgi:hypothetical protein